MKKNTIVLDTNDNILKTYKINSRYGNGITNKKVYRFQKLDKLGRFKKLNLFDKIVMNLTKFNLKIINFIDDSIYNK
tara:strand:- start:653 stop:883 length:231 start_codon:yes stop_codon:yes gene_type:complete